MKVGIVGAGLIGRLVAYYATQRGAQVTLFDRCEPNSRNSAGYIAAGMVAPYSEYDPHTADILSIGLASLSKWQQLSATVSSDVFYQQPGSVTVAFSQDKGELAYLQRRLSKVLGSVDILDSQQLQNVEKEIYRPELQGLFLENEGYVNVQKFFPEMADYLTNVNVEWIVSDEIDDIQPGCIKTLEKTYSFDWAFDCRGLGARNALTQLRGVRGELVWLHAPKVNIQRPIRFLHPRYPIYLVPRPNNHYILGATTIESEDTTPISVRSALELLTSAYSLHPEFSEARVIDTRVGCRPTFLDNQPKIHYQQGLVRLNGFYRHGYLYGPTVAEEAVNVVHQGLDTIKHSTLWEMTA